MFPPQRTFRVFGFLGCWGFRVFRVLGCWGVGELYRGVFGVFGVGGVGGVGVLGFRVSRFWS